MTFFVQVDTMKLLSLLLLICFFFADAKGQDENKNITWDYLIFAQVWPYSLCDVANLLHPDSCSVPKAVTGGWTVHGLWPTRDGQLGPADCVPADHFDLEKVKPIIDELLHHWPNLIPDQTLFSLWQHEWTKHGTCAEQLESTKGEFKYFSQGLQLNEKFSIRNILSLAGIVPSDDAKIKVADVLAAVEKARGKKGQAHCLKAVVEGKPKWYLVDVRVCVDKNLAVTNCPQPKSPTGEEKMEHHSELLQSLALPNVEQCPKDVLLYYVVPRDDHYHSDEQHEVHSYAHNYREKYNDKWDHRYYEEHDEL